MRRTSTHLLKGWRTGLPRLVLLLQVGNAVNFFGYGLIIAFEIIYLHQFRGIATATAGFVLATILGTATLVSPPTGALVDHFRPKPILIAGNLASALGYAGFAFVDRPWQAFACAAVGGAGIGAARVANQTLLITLVTPEQRAASFALGRVASNLGLGIGATVAGFIVASAHDLRSFQALYFFDAITYAGFALFVLAMVPNPRAAAAQANAGGRGFRAVVRDRLFMIVIAANIVLIIPGYALFSSILPPFVIAHTSVGAAGIGILKLSNTLFIVVAQLHATRVVKRMSRAKAFAALCAVWVIALLAVLPATLIHSEVGATVLLAGVAIMFAIGECMHAIVIGPLVADLAPEHLLGRYISVFGLMATAGLALGPAIGGEVLATSPNAVWWGGALVVAVIGAGFLLSGDRIPDHPLAASASNTLPATPRPTPDDARRQHAARAISTDDREESP
jgi:MFS family permease